MFRNAKDDRCETCEDDFQKISRESQAKRIETKVCLTARFDYFDSKDSELFKIQPIKHASLMEKITAESHQQTQHQQATTKRM